MSQDMESSQNIGVILIILGATLFVFGAAGWIHRKVSYGVVDRKATLAFGLLSFGGLGLIALGASMLARLI